MSASHVPNSEVPASEVISLLRRLVAIDSVNPTLVTGAPGETAIASFVSHWAGAAGLQSRILEKTPGRPSVLVWGGAGSGPSLLLCGHLDTVGVAGMAQPFLLREDGDRLWGRGAYDMKAGLAASLIACRDAVRSGVAGTVIVAAVADEEHSSLGIQEVLGEVSADAAVVCEPTEMTVGVAHKGFVWSEIAIQGRAAHGSRPHLGVDAIVKAGPVLTGVGALGDTLAARSHPQLGSPTVHASQISGGTEPSTIPDSCVLTVERRTVPGETGADVAAELDALLDACRADDPELRAAARQLMVRDPFEIAADDPFVGTVTEVVRAVTGVVPATGGLSYWADSAFLAAAGIPTVLFGPGGDGAHAADEWVSRTHTETCAAVLTALALRFCGRIG